MRRNTNKKINFIQKLISFFTTKETYREQRSRGSGSRRRYTGFYKCTHGRRPIKGVSGNCKNKIRSFKLGR